VWISALLAPGGWSWRVARLLRDGAFRVATSRPLIDELTEVLSRQRLVTKYAVTHERRDQLIELIGGDAIFVDIPGSLAVCRDPKDNMVLETAVAAGAEIIVTRDDDLKGDPAVAAFADEHDIQLLTVQRFVDFFV
jgi:putative PIN family toxin of toxin-antitoxin system